jgi:hypothetical protein
MIIYFSQEFLKKKKIKITLNRGKIKLVYKFFYKKIDK